MIVMKRKDLLKRVRSYAKANGWEFEIVEGVNHTRIRVGDRATVVPRHNEINEITAKHILKQIGAR